MRFMLRRVLFVFFLLYSSLTEAQFSYISPLPDSKMKNPETGVILRTGNQIHAASLKSELVSLTGSISGRNDCTIKLAGDGKTILITPARKFAGGETVTVAIADGIENLDGSIAIGTTFQFQTHAIWNEQQQAALNHARRQIKIDEYGLEGYESMFGTKNSDAQKLICNQLPPFTIQSTPGAYYDAPVFYRNQRIIDPLCHITTIISSSGDSIFSFYDNDRGIDFKINDNGYLTYYDATDSSFAMLDSSYNLVKNFYMGNGYFADEHEFRVYPDGTALLFCYDMQIVDMTQYGGPVDAQVTGLVIQQLDADDNVIFEWSGWDHIPIEHSNQILSNGIVDYIHGNSMELDYDGNLLLSSRHLDEITKIDLSTGDIIWRMGGDGNEFTFINEIGTPKPFSYQHHFRRIGNGLYSMFDNGNNQSPERSAAKEYLIDEVNKTATLNWYYYHPQVNSKEVMGLAMGSVERLPNGNRLIDWGYRKFVTIADIPNFTEVDSSGNIVWEFWFADSTYMSYRTFKMPWDRCNLVLPSAMVADSITISSALLTWNDNNKITSFILEYKKCNELDWISIPLETTEYQLEDLEVNTCYEWRVHTICDIYDETFVTEEQEFTTKDPLGIEGQHIQFSSLSVYPNPANRYATLQFDAASSASCNISILNLLGMKMQTIHYAAKAGFNRFDLDVSLLPGGTYVIEVKTESATFIRNLVVE